jgi:hypothetical protein
MVIDEIGVIHGLEGHGSLIRHGCKSVNCASPKYSSIPDKPKNKWNSGILRIDEGDCNRGLKVLSSA